jgi:2-keto-3-deoxygluconate permease
MNIKQAIERIPGGLMVVPLLSGALLNTIDQMHLDPVQAALAYLGATADAHGRYELLRIGSFTEALFKDGALALIGLFLVCVGA